MAVGAGHRGAGAWLPPAQRQQLPGEEAGGRSTMLRLPLTRVFPLGKMTK